MDLPAPTGPALPVQFERERSKEASQMECVAAAVMRACLQNYAFFFFRQIPLPADSFYLHSDPKVFLVAVVLLPL